MSVKVRERHDTKEPGLQVEIKAMPPGSLKAKRYRYTAPRSITSKSGAVRWGENVRREIEAGRPPPKSKEGREQATAHEAEAQPAATMTLRDGAAVYLADAVGRGNATPTLSSKRQRLSNILAVVGDAPLATFGEAEVSRVRTALRDAGLLPTTINAHLRLLQSVLHRCHGLGHRASAPSRIEPVRDRRVRAPRAYDDGVFEALVMQAAVMGPDFLGIVLVCGDAGLRVGELRGLEVRDIDAQRSALRVERSVNDAGEIGPPKNGEARVVPLTSRALAVLLQLAEGLPITAPLFTRPDGERMTRVTVRSWLSRVQRLAGLPDKGVHVLRHSCATSALAGGADVVAVQRLLGHRSLKTTLATYLHDTGDASERAVMALSAARSKVEAGVTDQSRVPSTAKRPRPKGRKAE